MDFQVWFRSLFFLPLLLCSYISLCPCAREMGGAGGGTGSRSVLAGVSLVALAQCHGMTSPLGELVRALEHGTQYLLAVRKL